MLSELLTSHSRCSQVLKDREAEIDALEKRLTETNPGLFPAVPLAGSMSNGVLPDVKEENDVASQPETLVESDLSPGIASQLNSLKHSMLIDEGRQEAERREAESISRLDELMRCVFFTAPSVVGDLIAHLSPSSMALVIAASE